jgi:hypothetical protein
MSISIMYKKKKKKKKKKKTGGKSIRGWKRQARVIKNIVQSLAKESLLQERREAMWWWKKRRWGAVRKLARRETKF